MSIFTRADPNPRREFSPYCCSSLVLPRLVHCPSVALLGWRCPAFPPALGPVLHVAGRQIVALPWALAGKLPLIKYALPVRFGNYAFLVLAIILSLWISGPGVRFAKALTVMAMIAIFPNPAFLFRESRYITPAFFADGLYRNYLARGDNVLVIPYGASGPSMAWQAQTRMYFRMPGGYIA